MDLVKHKAYSIAKSEIDEAMREIEASSYDWEVTSKSLERIAKYSCLLRDVLVDNEKPPILLTNISNND